MPLLRVSANEVIHAPEFPAPVRTLPRSAHRGDICQPGRFRGDSFQFFPITELVGPARALDAKQSVLSRHWVSALLPILIYGAHVANVGRNASDRSQEEMILAAAAQVQGEAPLGETAKQQRRAGVHAVEERRKLTFGDTLDEEFQRRLIGRRTDG